MTKLFNRTFLHYFLKMAPMGIIFTLLISANVMPSGTFLKVVQKSPFYIFVKK